MTDELVSRNPDKYYSKINVKDNAAIVRQFNDFGSEEEPVRFCEHCKENNIHNVLGPRLDYDERDKDDWLQCTGRKGCGKIFARYASKVESNVSDFVQTESNPHDSGHAKIIGIGNKRYKRSDIEKKRERQLRELDSIVDPDERRDRKKVGFVVEDYTD